MMKALLLAAGLGTRLAPITNLIPKCLVPIGGKPLLLFWFDLLFKNQISACIVNTHYFADAVEEVVDKSQYKEKVFLSYEKNLLGTGGTILKHRTLIGEEPFIVIYADNLSFFDVSLFIEAHSARPKNCEITMMLFYSPTPESCGVVELDNYGIVQGFYEKQENPPTNLANAAIYIMEPSVFDVIEKIQKPMIDISLDIIPLFLGRVYTFINDRYHRDIGTPESYAKALQEFDTMKLGCEE